MTTGGAGKLRNVAIIGCGAIAESFHLPALKIHGALVERLLMVDPSPAHAQKLAAKFDGDDVATSHTDVLDRIDAAIVTAPHAFHFPIARDCLERGIDVFLEKPLCETSAEAEELVGLAKEKGAVLAVNNTRRLIPACIEIKKLVSSGAIGELRTIDFREGDLFGWPLASGAVFRHDKGVLLDVGAHVVDLVCWWLGARPSVTRHEDDSFGGPEAVSKLSLEAGDATATIHLSWLMKQRNTAVLTGSKGQLEWSIYDWNVLTHTVGGRPKKVTARDRINDYQDLAAPMMERFLTARASGQPPAVAGEDVLDSIGVIEDAYARRSRFDLPWLQPEGVS